MISEHVYTHALGEFLSPIASILEDASVTDVMINGAACVYVERAGRIEKTSARFQSEAALLSALRVLAQYVGRPLDPLHPLLEARLPDGSRVEAVLSPIAKDGTHVAIRRAPRERLTCEALIAAGTLTHDCASWLRALVESKHNILVVGCAGIGKTSLLDVLLGFIPADERTVVLEAGRELRPRGGHVVQLEARAGDEQGRGAITLRDMFRAALRLRPDRIVVGELRDGVALDWLQAASSGHGGCLSTLHASHPGDALARLETLALMADTALPLRELRTQVSASLDVIVQLQRLRSGRRVVTHVSEVAGLDAPEQYRVHELFVRQERHGSEAGELVRLDCSASMRARLSAHALHLPLDLGEPRTA